MPPRLLDGKPKRLYQPRTKLARHTALYHAAVLFYYLRLALSQLARYRAQSLLAILGITIGVANIILLISITDLGKRQTTSFMDDLGASLVFVTPFLDMENGSLNSFSHTQAVQYLPLEALDVVKRTPGIDTAVAALMMPGHVGYGTTRWFTTLEGVSLDYLKVRNDRVSRGQWFSAADDAANAKVLIIGDTVRRELFGTADPLNKSVVVHGTRFTVAGAMAAQGRVGLEDIDNRVYMPLGTAQQLFGYSGIQGLLAKYSPKLSADQAVAAIKRSLQATLGPEEHLDDTYSVFTVKEARQLMDSTLGIFRVVLAGIASIALLVAGIGIMNVMLMRVLNRRLEIGVRRATGATRVQLLLQFLLESVVQALIGAACGIVLGGLGVWFYCRYAQWQWYISAQTILLAVVFSAVTGVLFGAYPAWRAAQLDPIRCLRD
jgi:putative ABC transport system permease protein